ncbi:MAG: TonB-dependent receptor, partial [Segatella copri]
MLKRLHLLLALFILTVNAAMAQITTSGISGKISSNGETVIGATVTATHQPSGTVYRAVTNVDGRYTIQGMRPGGPYKVSISYIGYKDKVFNNVSLNLGESQNLSCSLQEDAKQLQEVVVSGKAGLNGTKTGAAMSINAQQIADMPSISHSIADVARLNPQLTTNGQSGSMSFAGMNNRYNSFQIDGVMNNDVFGLTANGSNGGQAGSQPVSMETIDQIQVNIAPFDVRQGGFTGGAINAVTKSGTNEFHGSGYFYGNNQDLVGRHYKNMDGTYAQPYDDEKETLFGFTLGGPIIKNKLFFFANYENSEKSYPTQYTIDSPDVKFNPDLAKDLMSKIYDLANRQGYDYATSWADKDKNVKSQKAGLKLDWNINEFNKFSVRWSYVDAKQTLGLGGIATLNTTDHLYDFKSKTHSFSAELQSRISPNLSNEARVSYVSVRDERTSGQPAPSITIYKVGNGTMNIGNEYSSMANGLKQDIYTLEDNFTWYKGNHTLTFGTHNELYKFSNLFLQNLYGCYYFDTPDDFQNYYKGCGADGFGGDGKYIKNFYFTQANVEVTGNPRWAPEFSAAQLGFYVQDKWDVTDSFQLTYGLRMDMPLFFDTPAENAKFNEWAAGKGYGFKTNQKLASTPMWSPRVGFRWDIEKNRKYILRGGIGVFTGRIPFVWLSNNFTNTGVQTSSYSASKNSAVQLIMDPN